MLEYVLTIFAAIFIYILAELTCWFLYDTCLYRQISIRYEISRKINQELQNEPMLNQWHCSVEKVYDNKDNSDYECCVTFKRKKSFWKLEKYEYAIRTDYLYKLLDGDYKAFLHVK